MRVEQQGIDAVVEITDPDGVSLGVFDSPLDRRGEEWVLVRPRAPGSYRVEVRSRFPWAPRGSYAITWEVLPDDPARLAAEAAAATAAARYAREGEDPTARRSALEAYRQATDAWRTLGDRRREARALYCRAVLHRLLDETREALTAGEEVLGLWRGLGDELWTAYTSNELGLDRLALGEREPARELFTEAVSLFQQQRDGWGEAAARANLCLTALMRGELRRGVECYEPVIELYEAVGELPGQAVALANSGRAWDVLGEPERALELYGQALELRRTTGDRGGEAQVLNNLAVLHEGLGETQEAIAHHRQALAVFRRLDDRRWEARTLHNLGFAYQRLGDPDRARALYEEALLLRRELEDRAGEAATLNGLANIHFSEGDPETALSLHRRALELRRETGDRRGEAVARVLVGQDLREVGKLTESLAALRLGLAVSRQLGDRRNQALALQQMGRTLLAQGDTERAQRFLASSLELQLAVRDTTGEVMTRRQLAVALRLAGRLGEALAQAATAVGRVETLSRQVVSPGLRASWLELRRGVYELHIHLLMELHAAEPRAGYDRAALLVSERSRARVLLDLLREVGGAAGDEELEQRRRAARRRLASRVRAQAALQDRGAAGEAEAAAAQQEVYEALAGLEEVEARLRRQSPRYADLTRPQPLALEEIQQLLDPETLLLEYALGEERSFLWALEQERFTAYELPGRGEIEAAVRRVHRNLATVDPRGLAEETAVAAGLSRRLLGPVARRLGSERLVVVADGALHYLPFAALPDPRGGGEPLVARHEVVQLPSASVLGELRRRSVTQTALREAPRGPVAVFADPVFDRRDPRVTGAAAPAAAGAQRAPAHPPRPQLERLALTRAEAEAIATLAPAGEMLLALGFDARRERFLSEETAHARVLHLATHGLLNTANPALSGVFLSQVDAAGRPLDGFLGLHDFWGARLAAELVVLSGCRTALGREVRGEGLVGLTRGFMYAGVPRVVASLWPVEDRATTELMTHFYRALWQESLPPAAALRAAQLELRRQPRWRDPYYWAAFVLQGEWR